MGYRLSRHDTLIGQFLDYLEHQHESRISVEHALTWACLPSGARPRWHTARLAAIRGFAAHVHTHSGEAAELIPAGILPSRIDHAVPYLYTPAQITGLINHAYTLRPAVRGLTLATVIGLMAATGMRVGEALALDTTSLDAAGATIAVSGKYGRKRRLPVHSSTAAALTGYLRTSRGLVDSPDDQALFVTVNATRPHAGNVRQAFRALTKACRLQEGKGKNEPRLHDLRHTFAVNTLLDAHRAGVDVNARIAALATYLGHVSPASTYWYLTASPQLLDVVNDRVDGPPSRTQRMSTLTATLQTFFTTYLTGQRAASQHTISAYRDTWRMLLTYLHETTGIKPADIEVADLGVEAITGFLQYLETRRHNCVRTRNARLAAIHSFFSYAAYRHPEHVDLIARVLAIQTKKTHTTILTYLTDPEVDAILNGPDQATRTGRRDHVILLTLITTGLRVGELIALTQQDLHLARPAHLRVHGKGRKDRITPLNPATATALRRWTTQNSPRHPHSPAFTAQGRTTPISTDAIAARIRVHTTIAATTCPTLVGKNVTPHTLRHTTAMRMLDAGIDLTTIALWLGHESTESTQPYLHADLGMKQRALDRLTPPSTATTRRYRPDDQLLTFLEAL